MNPLEQSDLLSRIDGIFRLKVSTIERKLHPDFIRYFRNFVLHGADRQSYYRSLYNYKTLAKWHGRVLDLGCGYGVTSLGT